MKKMNGYCRSRGQAAPEIRSGLRAGCACVDYGHKFLVACYTKPNSTPTYATPYAAEKWLENCRKMEKYQVG